MTNQISAELAEVLAVADDGTNADGQYYRNDDPKVVISATGATSYYTDGQSCFLYNPEFMNLTAEEIYDILPEHPAVIDVDDGFVCRFKDVTLNCDIDLPATILANGDVFDK